MESIKLLGLFIAIVLSLRLKLSVGLTLFGAGILTAILYGIEPPVVLSAYWELVQSHRYLSLTGIVILVTIIGSFLRELGSLEKLTEIARGLFGGKRTAAVSLPILVGLMPMPGGSLLSAPLVDNVLNEERYQPHFKCIVNYWSRHTVEHFMPIYPGIIISAAVTGLPIGTIAILQLPLAIFMLALGIIFYARHIETEGREKGSFFKAIWQIMLTIWPILLIVAIYGFFKIDLAWGALITLVILTLVTRPKASVLYKVIREGLTLKLIFLVFGILSFQTLLELSGAVGSIQALATEHNLPVALIIFLVAFSSGVLTGMLAALIALSYSLLGSFLYQPEIIPGNIIWAFVSGYVGMMISPTHLCLTLTNQYFKSNLLQVVRNILLPLALLLLFGYLLAHSGWPELIYP